MGKRGWYLPLHKLWEKWVFSGCTVQPDIKESKLESSNQEVFPSTGKNTEIVLVPCPTWKCASTAISSDMDIHEVSGCHFLQQMSSQWGSEKLIQGLISELKKMTVLSKVCNSDHFESHNSLKPSFTNIWALHSNFDGCESFLATNSPDILALCETNLDESIYSGNFPLIWKDSIIHRHGLAVYVKLMSNLL